MWSHCPTSISYFSGLVPLGPCCRIALDIYLNIGTTKSLPQQIQMWPPPGAFTEHFIPVWQGAGELKGLGNPRILAGIFDLEPNRDEIRTSHCLIRRSWCLMLIRGKKKKKVGSCERQGAPPLMKYERSLGMLMLGHPLAYQWSDYGFRIRSKKAGRLARWG